MLPNLVIFTRMLLFLDLMLNIYLGGGFKYCSFSPLLGEDFQFDDIIFFKMGWFNHQLD